MTLVYNTNTNNNKECICASVIYIDKYRVMVWCMCTYNSKVACLDLHLHLLNGRMSSRRERLLIQAIHVAQISYILMTHSECYSIRAAPAPAPHIQVLSHSSNSHCIYSSPPLCAPSPHCLMIRQTPY